MRGSRAVALSAAKTLIPTSRLGLQGLAHGARLISALPAGPSRALLRLTTKSARLYNSMTVDDRTETLDLEPPVVCVLAVNPDPARDRSPPASDPMAYGWRRDGDTPDT